MRIVFMGTPDIAQKCLKELIEKSKSEIEGVPGGFEIAGVYTRPDKPVGRKQVLTASPVKQTALENGIPVFQPSTLRSPEALQQLKSLNPALVVVVAYGMLLPPDILALPEYGCINLHVSLLPKYRGAAPIQWALIKGETKTGVTIMQLDKGMDTGPVITQQVIDIKPEATAGDLMDVSADVGSKLLVDTVAAIFRGETTAKDQQGEATLAPMLDKTMAQVDFNRSADEIHNLVRGCNPWPAAWFMHEGKRVKILRSKVSEQSADAGEVVSVSPLVVGCAGSGSLILEMVHPEGSRQMEGNEWAAGRRFSIGQKLV